MPKLRICSETYARNCCEKRGGLIRERGRTSAEDVRPPASTGLGGVTNYQIKCSGRDFAKPSVAVQRNGNADRGIVARKAESTFHQPIINLVHMQWSAGFAQDHCGRLGNRAVIITIGDRFDV